jgi:transposase
LCRIVLEAVPDEAVKAVGHAAGVKRAPAMRVAWARLGGQTLFCLETNVGIYRVVHSSWGWRADEVMRDDVFVKEPGLPVDPRRRACGQRTRVVETDRYEIDATAWRRVEKLFKSVGRQAHPGPARYSDRAMLSGVIYRLRKQLRKWSEIPSELGYGEGSTIYRRLRSWEEAGIWSAVRERLEGLLPDGRELDWDSLAPGKGDGLNRRQRAFLADLRRHPGLVQSTSSYAKDYRAGYETAREDLVELVGRGVLRRRRQGRRGFLFEAKQ